ncbi:MAG: LytTR family DNA-binding domain-containing protein [Butyrivibrio sp.]|uniref:LytR/AlgR family response regulator transcription factor n=1 Tax=Butyrivibrio sp. TaxID=28121 RepID=UPI0025FF40E5|nr:LytTR family DNA-binding domain-containing protein [Butyrivibrio sp.]MCR5769630.1 LytTR family DNA-binding domain-containing protein [Butyrivibrio sp.]
MDKYRFAVCDDEEAVRSLISEWLLKSPYKAEIKEYDSGEELLRDIDAGVNPDILFLDIAMGGADGIDTARELGKRVENNGRSMRASRPLIIYVTGIPDRMGDAFLVKAFDYLLKPVTQIELEDELKRAVDELKRLDAQHLSTRQSDDELYTKPLVIQTGRDMINIKQKHILYIESSGRKSIVHAEGKALDVYKRMNEFEDELGNSFFRIHRGYLVNMQHIKGYSRSEAYMDNGETLIISKYKYADFVRAYMNFIS